MKRNRKAEAQKKKRKLSRLETERRRLAALLTEMEAAVRQVLTSNFQFTGEQANLFAELVRGQMQGHQVEIKTTGVFNRNRHLTETAQRFGLAGMAVLKEHFDFTAEQLDSWLQNLIEAGNENRANDP